MKINYDELYNKFVESELSDQDLKIINNLIEKDDEFKVGIQTHKFVHSSLFDIPLIKAPIEITAKVMEQIVSGISIKYEKYYFFRTILGIFGVTLLVSVFMFVQYSANTPNSSESFGLFDIIKQYTIGAIPQIYFILNNDIIKTIGGLISFIILLAFYFSFNEYKTFKEKLKQF